jgi:hypothetical protein|tara:strand:+ start:718 stop:975 length:258 start_codon:yes stop_codon:yes gene_type:complete
MPKKKKQEKTEAQEVQGFQEQDLVASFQVVNEDISGIKIQMITIAKEVLERNAALQWEQDKTRGLTITVDEIIDEAEKLVRFVTE